LVREDRYKEAAGYLTKPYDKVLAKYVQALDDGANQKLSKDQRAKAWFAAAWIARYDGLEIMGTEVAPDGFIFEGDFQNTDIAALRRGQAYPVDKYSDDENAKKQTKPFDLKVSKQEEARLSKSDIVPDLRYHYRVIAGALAMRAAALMPDNTEELADVINAAGNWVKSRDDKLGDKYFAQLRTRASKTKIGGEALSKHWFVDDDGPWSTEQGTARDAMLKELGIGTDQQ
jgi:hypothetical protein